MDSDPSTPHDGIGKPAPSSSSPAKTQLGDLFKEVVRKRGITEQLQRPTEFEKPLEEIKIEDVVNMVNDPFYFKPPKFEVSTGLTVLSFAIAFFAPVLMAIAGILDIAIPWGPSHSLQYLLYQVAVPTVIPKYDKVIFKAIGNFLGNLLVVVLSTVGIGLDLVNKKFGGSLAASIFQDKFVLAFAGGVIILNILLLFVAETCSDYIYQPRSTIIMLTLSSMVLSMTVLPFLSYLLFFLDPDNVLPRTVTNALNIINNAKTAADIDSLNELKESAASAIEQMRDTARKSIERKNKTIASKAVDALCSFQYHYSKAKGTLPESWGSIPPWIRYSPDFLTSSKEAVSKIEATRTWIEWKIFRQYYELFDVAIHDMKEVCYHIGMNSRYMGESSAVAGDMAALDLAIKFFNSYLRLSLNASNVHTVYTVLFQYRLLGEFLVKYTSSLKQSRQDPDKIADLEKRVFRIPKHLRYYSSQFKLRGIHFLVEVVAHDVRILCEVAAKLDAEIHHQLVDIFLTICDQYPPKDKLAKGCRVAQICLATYYLNIGKEEWARKIYHEVNQDSPENLLKYFQMIKNIIIKEFFEVSERGIDFQYISSDQKEKLVIFKSWFKELKTPRITIPAESGVL